GRRTASRGSDEESGRGWPDRHRPAHPRRLAAGDRTQDGRSGFAHAADGNGHPGAAGIRGSPGLELLNMSRKRALRTALSCACGAVAVASAPADADTVKGALVQAYETNPTLQAARAQQRATDENVPIERSAGLPSVTGQAVYNEVLRDAEPDPVGLFPDRTLTGSVSLTVPIYSG